MNALLRTATALGCCSALALTPGCSDSARDGDGPTSTSRSVAATYSTLAPGEVRLHTHPADPIFLSSRSDSGELTEVFGVRTPTGNIERATRLRTQLPGQPAVVVHLDELERVVKAEADGLGGVHLNWLVDDIIHLRLSNERQEITFEWWVDAITGDEVPRPDLRLANWSIPAEPEEAESFGSSSALRGTGDETSLRIPILDCDGVVSERQSNLIDRVSIEFDVGSTIFELPAARGEDGYWDATIPRQLTGIEWNTAECQAALCGSLSCVQPSTCSTSRS